MWHASVAAVRSSGPVPWALLPPRARVRLREVAAALLRGVGTGPEIWQPKPSGVAHLRRSLSDAEIAGLDPAWVAIPPVDMG